MSKSSPHLNMKVVVREQFSHVAANYSVSQVHAAGEDLEKIADCARLAKNMVVLDAGCGAGHAAIACAPHAQMVIAYDFTFAMLEQARRLISERGIGNIIAQQGDVEQLPFCEHVFDVIVSRYSAHHWLRPEKVLLEFARVLKPGGQFILSDVVAPENYAQDTFLQTFELLRDSSHVRDHSISQWVPMFERAGFSAEVVLRFSANLHFQDWLDRMATPELNRRMIWALFDHASEDMREGFQLPDALDGEFVVPGAVIRGRLIR